MGIKHTHTAIPNEVVQSAFWNADHTVDDDVTFPLNKKLWMQTDQRNIHVEGHKADLIKLKAMDEDAKPTIAFTDELGNDRAWLVCHDYLTFPTTQHKHFSIETTKADETLTTRMEFPYGADTINIQTHDSNFIVGGTGTFKVNNGNSEFGGDVTVTGGAVRIDSAGAAAFTADRGMNTNFATFNLKTAGTEFWAFQMRDDETNDLHIRDLANGRSMIQATVANKLGFFQATPVIKQTVTGSRGGNAALASLLTALANLGLITDSTEA